MKYIKVQDTFILFDEITNHGSLARAFEHVGIVQSAGFVKMFPTTNNLVRMSLGGQSSTLKIKSTLEDRELVEKQIHMTKEKPVRFMFANTMLVLFASDSKIDVEALIKAKYHYSFVTGSVYFTTEESDSMFHESGWKAVPHFNDVQGGEIDEALLYNIDFNIRAE